MNNNPWIGDDALPPQPPPSQQWEPLTLGDATFSSPSEFSNWIMSDVGNTQHLYGFLDGSLKYEYKLEQENVALRQVEREHITLRHNYEKALRRIEELERQVAQTNAATAYPSTHQGTSIPQRPSSNPFLQGRASPFYRNTAPAPVPAPAPPPATHSYNLTGRKPYKLCGDPDKFEGDKTKWRHFKGEVEMKLSMDGAFYETANQRMMYVMSRTKGAAYSQVCSFLDNGAVKIPGKPNADWRDVIEVLEGAFGDPNFIHTARRDFHNLQMNKRDFMSFVAEFRRLCADLNKRPDDCIHDFWFKLTDNLRNDLKAVASELQNLSFSGMVSRIQTVVNEERAISKRFPSTASQATVTASHATTTPPTTTADGGTAMEIDAFQTRGAYMKGRREGYTLAARDGYSSSSTQRVTKEEMARRYQEDLCAKCGKAGHWKRDCPDNHRAFRPTILPRGRALGANALDLDPLKDDDDSSHSDDSGKV